MKRIAFVGLSVIVVVILFAGILLFGKGVEAVNVKINKKDFPQHGVTIIGPSEPAFDLLMSDLAQGRPDFPAEELKPFSVFIKNTGKRSIVAYKLRWECRKGDGTVIYKDSSFSAAWVLMSSGAEQEQAITQADTIIKPDSTWFLSLNSDPLPLYHPPTGPEDFNKGHGVSSREPGQVVVQGSEKIAALRRSNAKELAQYTDITIILDGAFFDDGSFVGQDSTGFFDAVKAEVDANRDVLREIQAGFQQSKPTNEIFKRIEDLTAEPDVSLGPDSTPLDYYNYHKKEIAREYLGYKEAWGGDNATKRALQQLNKTWAKLRKL